MWLTSVGSLSCNTQIAIRNWGEICCPELKSFYGSVGEHQAADVSRLSYGFLNGFKSFQFVVHGYINLPGVEVRG